jgi:hypothetical protein
MAADVVYREDSAAQLAETVACAIPAGSTAPFLLGDDRERAFYLFSSLATGFTNRVIGADTFFDSM